MCISRFPSTFAANQTEPNGTCVPKYTYIRQPPPKPQRGRVKRALLLLLLLLLFPRLAPAPPSCLYRHRGKLFPEALWEVGLLLLASDVIQGVVQVPLHLGASVGRVQAVHVLVDEGNEARDVTPGDLIGGRGA